MRSNCRFSPGVFIGARYGVGIKQLATVDSYQHIIMDYSVHDAIAAGFKKIIFVIRKDIEQDFRDVIGDRIEKVCRENNVEVFYAYQSLDAIPDGFSVPEGRQNPWGTGQAVLAAKDYIKEPFVIINADDYYGKHAFATMRDFLLANASTCEYCMAGFVLKNTLSENGAVTRGICQIDENGYLTDVVETRNIQAKWLPSQNRLQAVVGDRIIDSESIVSMNMWGLTPDFLCLLEQGFWEFFVQQVPQNPLKAEFLIPIFIGQLLAKGAVSVRMLRSGDRWFGVTYKEDIPAVAKDFRQLIENGVYRKDLYSDLPKRCTAAF